MHRHLLLDREPERNPAILEVQGISATDRSGNSVSATLPLADLQRILSFFATSDTSITGSGTAVGVEEDEEVLGVPAPAMAVSSLFSSAFTTAGNSSRTAGCGCLLDYKEECNFQHADCTRQKRTEAHLAAHVPSCVAGGERVQLSGRRVRKD